MKKVLFAFLLLNTLVFAQEDHNSSKELEQQKLEQLALERQQKEQQEKERQREEEITADKNKLLEIDRSISDENVWIKSYATYLAALRVKDDLEKIKIRIKWLKKYGKSTKEIEELNSLIAKETILTAQIGQLKEEHYTPFSELITPPKIEESPEISNPFDIFTGLSLIKTINNNLEEYKKKKESLEELIGIIKKELNLREELQKLGVEGSEKEVQDTQIQLTRLESALDTMNSTLEVYQKRLDITAVNINKGVQTQIYRLMKIGIAILVVFFIFFILKLIIKKYITDNERFYMANKIITFANFIIILLIVFFNYIENASYLVTILGFASAGIAIAMKDWFMSLLGWLVIVFGGSIHVGDRIRVDMDGMRYVGDVLDISLLRITVLEDVTLTSVMENRRAGRIIFIPNNYIFTKMIANYTHNSLKTVWDGIKITITFDSNHKKAMYIVKEITKKYSKGYTDITRKQLNKLRQHYSLKNTNVEPRIYSFIEPYGLNVEAWYLTNAYATLTLRSVISTEIVDAFNEADDITIAYPTQKLHVDMQSQKPSTNEGDLV